MSEVLKSSDEILTELFNSISSSNVEGKEEKSDKIKKHNKKKKSEKREKNHKSKKKKKRRDSGDTEGKKSKKKKKKEREDKTPSSKEKIQNDKKKEAKTQNSTDKSDKPSETVASEVKVVNDIKSKHEKLEDGEISDGNNSKNSKSKTPTLEMENRKPVNGLKNAEIIKKSNPSNEIKKKSPSNEIKKKSPSDEVKKKEKSNKNCRSKRHSTSQEREVKDKSKSEKTEKKDKERDRSRSRERKRSRDRKRSHSPAKKISRSQDRKRSRSIDRLKRKPKSRSRSRDNKRKRSRSRSRSRKRDSHRSKREREKDEFYIDKSKLLEIARKNALNMMKHGQTANEFNKVTAITAGGKTVDELTDFCKLLAQKEATGKGTVSSDSSSENESERPFHHPFLLKERPNNIVMNIRNSATLPVKSHLEKATENLRLQFPVSSGQHHRKTESDWVPVEKKTELKAIMPPPPPPPAPAEEAKLDLALVPLPPSTPKVSYDVGSIVSERLAAIRSQHDAAYPMQNCWSNQVGLFTGSTGARVLSQAELAAGAQAWARKDQLMSAQPVSSGMGMSLLQKMGWKPGEGLGKNNEGSLEPLKLPVKMDKKGLVCSDEMKRQRMAGKGQSLLKAGALAIEGKHPVSLLVEYCSRRHFPPPIFTVVLEDGPAHKRTFVFKVTVNNIDFQPSSPSPNKKQAKSEAALVCLRKLGILPCV